MSMLKWIKEKYTKRKITRDDTDPWWVTLMLDVGRPLVAVLILCMCAPGEHHLAVEAGWSETLAWGMPGALTAYAGIAAVVATKRPKGAPGRKTAIWGAILSILTAMAAQPIAHLYGRQGLDTQAISLTIAAGLVPGAVFGHLLHMGAAGAKKAEKTPVASTPEPAAPAAVRPPEPAPAPLIVPASPALGQSDGQTSVPQWLADNLSGTSVSELMSAGQTDSPDAMTWTGHPDTDADNRTPDTTGQDTPDKKSNEPDTDTRTDHTEDVLSEIAPASLSAVRPAVRRTTSNVRSIKKGSLAADVRTFMSGHPDADDSDLAAAMALKWPDKPWDSVRKARDRYQEKIDKETGS